MMRKRLRQAIVFLLTISMLAISLPEASLTALAEEEDVTISEGSAASEESTASEESAVGEEFTASEESAVDEEFAEDADPVDEVEIESETEWIEEAEETDPVCFLNSDPAEDIEINEDNFPDEYFREYASEEFDADGDGWLSEEEIGSVSSIDIKNKNISTLQGIEFFGNLMYLNCSNNNLSSLEVSANLALENLWCPNNNLSSLDVSHNTSLEILYCFENNLSSLDVSGNPALTNLACHNNNLSSLDVSHNPALEWLCCSDNNLSSLDVSHNPALTELSCYTNSLNSLDVSHNPALTYLSCINNNLSSLDVSQNPALMYLYCSFNNLGSLDVSGNPALERLSCYTNSLNSLDVSHNPALTELSCYTNSLNSLDVSHNPALTVLYCSENNLSSLDVSHNTVLTGLDCSNNNLSSLDVSGNPALIFLHCWENNLTSLDVSESTALTQLLCYNNNLSSLDVSKNTLLTEFNCINNVYTIPSGDTLDLSSLPGFEVSKASGWQNGTVDGTILTSIGLRVQYTYDCGNGFTCDFTMLFQEKMKPVAEINKDNFPDENFREYVSENFDVNRDGWLSKYEIGNISYINVSNKNISTLKGIEFFGNLTTLYCSNNNLSSLDVSHNPALERLDCFNTNLSSLDVSQNPALTDLQCGRNNLSSLDVSGNPALTVLACGMNNLSSLDVSHNSALRNLYCPESNLSSLDVSQNPVLTHLSCGDNNLSSLDVSGNPALTNLLCHQNNLTSLDVSHNPVLERLYCYQNNLSSLDVSHNPALTEFNCSNNVYHIPSGSTFDLSTLPGFDVSKASDWQNGTVDGTTLTLTGGRVTYTYDCGQSLNGRSFSRTFCLKAAQWPYNITYHLNGGTNNSQNPTQGDPDTAVTLQNPTRAGYKFLGWYTDAGFKKKVTSIPKDTESDVQLYAKWEHTAHTYKDKVTPATLSKDGSIQPTCSVCGAAKKATAISRPATIKLSAESYVYDGKVKKPTVTVKDKSGKTIAASNYTVTYASGRKNVGSYTVKVTFKGNYSGSKTLSFAINPAPAKSLSVSPGSGKLTVKWKKNATQISGYEIMYSTSSSFAKAGTKTVTAKSSAAQKEIKKLKAKTTYYVRVRTYKTVGKQKYYSAWSKTVKVTTKK